MYFQIYIIQSVSNLPKGTNRLIICKNGNHLCADIINLIISMGTISADFCHKLQEYKTFSSSFLLAVFLFLISRFILLFLSAQSAFSVFHLHFAGEKRESQ